VIDKPAIRADGRWQERYRERRFAVLLVILIALLAGPPILFGEGMSSGWFDGVVSLLLVASILSLCLEPRERLFALILGIPTILFSLGGHAISGEIGSGVLLVGHLCEVLFLFGAATLIVRSLLSNQSIQFDGILGAVCGYLFLGLGWAVLYSMVENFEPGSFDLSRSLAAEEDPARPLPHVLTYYSFVTLTTVGYGDVSPISSVTRTLSWLEAMTGQFYLAVIVAGLVSILTSRK
jgi:hypothetical protein